MTQSHGPRMYPGKDEYLQNLRIYHIHHAEKENKVTTTGKRESLEKVKYYL
jgi:hypothetical protein